MTDSSAAMMSGREDQAWRNAYYIAWVGASNPVAVRSAYDTHLPYLGADHPAMRAIRGQLEFLQGTSPGPDMGDLSLVLDNARRLGLTGDDGKYIPQH